MIAAALLTAASLLAAAPPSGPKLAPLQLTKDMEADRPRWMLPDIVEPDRAEDGAKVRWRGRKVKVRIPIGPVG